MDDTKTLLEEDHIVSLRTAFIQENDKLVQFRLFPAFLDSSLPRPQGQGKFDWASQDCAWLYRHLRSPVIEAMLRDTFPCMDLDVKPLNFTRPPQFKLVWADSGNSVALYLNGEPWAFIDEATHEGYSKGILVPKKPYYKPVGRFWDQMLFERLFPDAPPRIELLEKGAN